MVRLIGGSIAPFSQKVRILIDIPLAGKAELKNGFAARKMDPQTPNLWILSEGVPYHKKH
jgi:hypothetical protein